MRSSIAATTAKRRRRGLAAIAFASLPLLSAVQSNAGPSAEAQMFRLVSAARAIRALPAVAVDPVLARAARARSLQMARAGDIWHDRKLPHRLAGWRLFGENVGVGVDLGTLHDALMQSPSHRRNILFPGYGRVGIGITVTADGAIYVAQLFTDRAVGRMHRVQARAATIRAVPAPLVLPKAMPWVLVQFARAVRALLALARDVSG